MLAEHPLLSLFILAIPIACIAWTVTHEEVFREPREWCVRRSRTGRSWLKRKFFYLFTCEYCFSHWVALGFLFLTRYKLLLDDWRGYVIAGFALVWVANVYMSAFGRLRLDLKHERVEIAVDEAKLDEGTLDEPRLGEPQLGEPQLGEPQLRANPAPASRAPVRRTG